MEKITKEDYEKAERINRALSLQESFMREKANKLESQRENIFVCEICKGYFKGEGHRLRDTIETEETLATPKCCDNCLKDEITTISIIRPTDDEIKRFDERDVENKNWFNFTYQVDTLKGHSTHRYDVLEFIDENRNSIIHIDFVGNGFRIHSDFKITQDDKYGCGSRFCITKRKKE